MPYISPPPPRATPKRLLILDCALSSPNFSAGRILSATTTGADVHAVRTNMSTLPDGIALDRAAGHMYVTQMGSALGTDSGSIVRAGLDGTGLETVVATGSVGVWTPKQVVFVEDAGRKWIY